MIQNERHDMTLRSSGRLSVSPTGMKDIIQIPISDTHSRFEYAGRAEAVLDRHQQERAPWMCGQRRQWETMQHGIESGQQSGRRIDVEGYGGKTRITYSKEHPSPDQAQFIGGVNQPLETPLDTQRRREKQRPVSSYKKNLMMGQTFLVPQTAHSPVEKRIFLHTHYSGYEGRAVGIRAPSRYEDAIDKGRLHAIRPMTSASGERSHSNLFAA